MRSNIRMLPDVSLNGVYKSFGRGENKVEALRNINLEIHKGEFVALCGPSGSGKSTLLNVLSGIDQPSAGFVLLLNKFISEMSENDLAAIRSRDIGFIFQFFNLIPVLNIYDNIYYPMVLNGHFDKKIARERTLHFLDDVGLAHLSKRRPGQLSGGQQQRVAIARALVHQPQVVIADEPTGNLDQATGEAIIDLMLKINQERGTTFVISTHATQIKERAHRVVEIKDGEVACDSEQ